MAITCTRDTSRDVHNFYYTQSSTPNAGDLVLDSSGNPTGMVVKSIEGDTIFIGHTTLTDTIECARYQEGDIAYAKQMKNLTFGTTQALSVWYGSNQIWNKGAVNYSYIFRDIDSNGALTLATGTLESAEGITTIPEYGLIGAFSNQTNITGSVSFPDLETVECNGLRFAFYGASKLNGTAYFPKLKTIDVEGCYYFFDGDAAITGVDLGSLTDVADKGLYGGFMACTKLASVDLNKLESVGSQGMYSCFYGDTSLTTLALPTLSTVQANALERLCYNCTKLTTISLPSIQTLKNKSGSYLCHSATALRNVDLSRLEVVEQDGLERAFYNINNIGTVVFPKLKTLKTYAMEYAFGMSSSSTSTGRVELIFPALDTSTFTGTNMFYRLLYNRPSGHTMILRFPSSAKTFIEGLSDYSSNFGANTKPTVTFGISTITFEITGATINSIYLGGTEFTNGGYWSLEDTDYVVNTSAGIFVGTITGLEEGVNKTVQLSTSNFATLNITTNVSNPTVSVSYGSKVLTGTPTDTGATYSIATNTDITLNYNITNPICKPASGTITFSGVDKTETITLEELARHFDVELTPQSASTGWQESTITNPKASEGWKVYESMALTGTMQNRYIRIRFARIPNFKLYLAVDGYVADYTIVYALDSTTSSKQTINMRTRKVPTALSDYTEVSLPNDGGEHYVYINYWGYNISSGSATNKSYLLVDPNQ